MELVWNEILSEEKTPRYPEEDRELLFYVYETEDTYIGTFDKEDNCFYSKALPEERTTEEYDYYSPGLSCVGLRIAWSYIYIDTAMFKKFKKIEDDLEENYKKLNS